MNVESVTKQAEARRSEAELFHDEADRCNRLILDNVGKAGVEPIDTIIRHRDYLRRRAADLEELSYRLREQARRVARERQDSANSCRVCCMSIPTSEDGLCYICRDELLVLGNRSRCE